jgi:hypothetical protein
MFSTWGRTDLTKRVGCKQAAAFSSSLAGKTLRPESEGSVAIFREYKAWCQAAETSVSTAQRKAGLYTTVKGRRRTIFDTTAVISSAIASEAVAAGLGAFTT